MAAIRQILVPVDFSEPSRAALDYAAELGRPFGASLDVLHVYEMPLFVPGLLETAPSDTSYLDLMRSNAERLLADLVADAKKRGISVRAARAELGPPSQTITAAAQAGGYDPIVIGTHGRTGLGRALIGSVAERVVRHAPCAVLAVRAHPTTA